ALGGTEPTPEEVVKAARAAGLGEVIAGLPERDETIIGERGANLSGGQSQLLALVRPLFIEPKNPILDEARSQLDSDTARLTDERPTGWRLRLTPSALGGGESDRRGGISHPGAYVRSLAPLRGGGRDRRGGTSPTVDERSHPCVTPSYSTSPTVRSFARPSRR